MSTPEVAAEFPIDCWKRHLSVLEERPTILLCGAKVWPGSHNLDHRVHWQNANWVTTDIEAGDEVDIVGDLQSLWKTCERRFHAIFCPAVLEHIERPWTAMYSMAQLLLPRGVLYLQTHQTFPLHGYPNDYFRFSAEAIKTLLFDASLHALSVAYEFPCTITPVECEVWNPLAPAYLNVTACGQKGAA